MKHFFVLTIFGGLLINCSSAPVKNTETANANVVNRSTSENSAAKNVNDNAAPLTMEEFANSNNKVTDENANRSGLSGNPMSKNSRGRKLNNAPVDPHAEAILTVAPDNSVITTSMNQNGAPIETRTFKSHPVLIKVERVYADLKNPTVKVYLKNGKTFDLPKDKISDIFNVSANEILNAVGVAPSN